MSQGEKMTLPKLVWMHGNELGPEWTYDQYSVSVAGNGLSKAEALEVIAIVEDRYPRQQEKIEALVKAINEARMRLQLDAYMVGLPADSILEAALAEAK